jgi:hypothetical protein
VPGSFFFFDVPVPEPEPAENMTAPKHCLIHSVFVLQLLNNCNALFSLKGAGPQRDTLP